MGREGEGCKYARMMVSYKLGYSCVQLFHLICHISRMVGAICSGTYLNNILFEIWNAKTYAIIFVIIIFFMFLKKNSILHFTSGTWILHIIFAIIYFTSISQVIPNFYHESLHQIYIYIYIYIYISWFNTT